MHHHGTLSAAAIALLSLLPAAQAGLYPKSSPVLQVEAKNYDRLIARSNHTSIVEFYAPWCGHCQNLKPAYEKAARNLEGLANVAAVNCDDDANKPFCGSMGVQGFPTLKIVRPGVKKGAKPVVEDYQGPRTAVAIVEAVVDRINNHVKRVGDKEMDAFLADKNDTAKAILFTEKGTTSALLKSIAIDFLGVIPVAQVRSTAKKAVDTFGIEKFPTLVLLPGSDKDAVVYDGEMKKPGIVKFLSQVGEPNPPVAAAEPKDKKASSKSKAAKQSSSSTSSEVSTATERVGTEHTEIPIEQKPVILDSIPAIPTINTAEKLAKECLSPKSHTCILAFVPGAHGEEAETALDTLASLAHKHAQSKRHLFPFFEVHADDAHAKEILDTLGLKGEVEIIAVNARRNWWRHYEGSGFGHEAIEGWIDQIRLSEGAKQELPEGILVAAVEDDTPSRAAPETSSEPPDSVKEEVTPEETVGAAAEEKSPDIKHEEL
ncbi:Protein disulfide-isomerase MPD1 [Pleurostoma richardsiae]|uniref:protein disulfide-isomerase n=1 Tax=Pleurostoma richardsiae TaxID=41990 RepID=A0AA38R3R3_9PEZI|nr:Protein disulfide-isomerase MPD1 [Pleurostoma richardsiae]